MRHKIQILAADKTDNYEGAVQSEINEKDFKAFFYGEEFELGYVVDVEFNHLEYPLEWDVIFNENKDEELKLEKSMDQDGFILDMEK